MKGAMVEEGVVLLKWQVAVQGKMMNGHAVTYEGQGTFPPAGMPTPRPELTSKVVGLGPCHVSHRSVPRQNNSKGIAVEGQ